MPAVQYFFSGAAFMGFLGVVASIVALFTVGAGWYRAAVTESTNAMQVVATREGKERGEKVKTLLVAALNESNGVAQRITPATIEASDKETDDWGKRTYDLIVAAYGESEAALFLNNSGYVFYGDGSPASKMKIWVDGRQRRLTELLARASTLTVRDDFDPAKFQKNAQATP